MRSKFWIYASLGLVAAASIGVAATFAYAASGQIALVKSNINIVTSSVDLVYNGEIQEIHGNEGAYYNGELNMGDGIFFIDQVTEAFKAGKYENKVKYDIINANGQNVKKDYNIKNDFGIIKVKKRKLEVSVKEGCESEIPEGKNPIDISKLTISGDGIADNDDVTFYCNKIMNGNSYKFTYSLESQNKLYNTSTTNCYTLNPEPLYIDESILDYLPPGTQLPDLDDFENFDPDNIPPDAFINPELGDIAGGPDINSQMDKTAIMKVKSESRGLFLLRGESFGDYNYKGFEKANAYSNNYGYNPNQFFSNYLSNHERRALEITYLNNFYSKTDFAPYFCDNYDYQENDIKFTFAKNDKRSYTTYSYGFVPQTNLDVIDRFKINETISNYEKEYRDFVYNNYLTMPDPFYKDSMINYLAGEGIDINLSLKEFDKELINMFERDFKYDLKAYSGSSDTVYEFLNNIKMGNCQNFASAATLIYRAKGIPARYTTGYFFLNREPGKTTIVTPFQAHAWVEIYKDGYGWLPLDYTIGSLENAFGEEEVDPEIEDPNDTGEEGDALLPVSMTKPQTNYLMEVKASTPGKYYLREESYGDFNLKEFTPGNKYKVENNTNPNHFTGIALSNLGKNSRNIDITYKEKFGKRHQLVPTYFSGNGNVNTDCDLYYDYASINETKNLSSYDFDYISNSDELSDYKIKDPLLEEEEYKYYYYAKKHYLDVPRDIKAIVEEALLEYSPVIPQSPDLICRVISDYFRDKNIVFNPDLEFSYEDLVNDIEGFFKNNAGECNAKSVAAMATMLLRSLKIPTRLVKGFLYIAEDTNAYALNNYNEHYWNEIYIKGVGWVEVDFISSSGKLLEDYFTGKTHITIKTDNQEVTYNGKFNDGNLPYVLEGDDQLESNHFLYYDDSVGGIDIDQYELVYNYSIRDNNFAEKNYRYAIDEEFGVMNINKASITIYTKSISETFQAGKVLKTEIDYIECDTFTIDDLDFIFEGSQLTNVGQMNASIDLDTLEIVNASGVDITSNFEIRIVEGVLEFK